MKLSLGAIILFVLTSLALLSLFWTPYAADMMHIQDRLSPPFGKYWLGTDAYGRDLLSMIMVGSFNSLSISLPAVLIGSIAGIILGLISALHSQPTQQIWLDRMIGSTSDLIFAFPALLTAILLTAIRGADGFNVMIAIALFNLPVFMRMTRVAARDILHKDYVRAALMGGRSQAGIIFLHILPNIKPILIIQGAIQCGIALLIESGLSYLGFGLAPPEPSLGRLLANSQTYLYTAPHLMLFSGGVIFSFIIAVNLVAEGLRDHFHYKK